MNPGELDETLADILRQEIDREIITEFKVARLIEQGWFMVTVFGLDMEGIGPWMEENIRGNWRGFTTKWMFESEDDAILFKLRWS